MSDFQSEITVQSRLVELLNILTPEEKAQMLPFMSAPMFNNSNFRAKVGPFIEICLNHPWDNPEIKLIKNHVFALLYPGQDFVDGKLEKIMVEAFKVARSFLLAQNYFRSDNEFQQTLDFSEMIRLRGLDARHQQFLIKIKKIQEDFPWDNATFLNQQFLLDHALHENECFHNQVKGDLNVPNTLQSLDRHYHLKRLELLNRLILQQKAANLQISDAIKVLIEEIQVPARYLDESPSIRINHEIFILLQKENPEPSDVRSLFDLLQLHEKKLSSESLKEFYSYLRNLCTLISRKQSDNEEIRLTLFELYKDNLPRGYLHFEGKLHPSLYLAVTTVALRVNQFDWALDFVEKHKHEIIGETEDKEYYRFNKAYCLFGAGEFSECLDNIPATIPMVDHLIQSKRLELKALYELNSDLFPYKLDAFRMFLSRTSQKILSNENHQLNLEFLNFLTQLVSSIPGDKKRSEVLVGRIEEKKQVAEWLWLHLKAQALGKSR